MPTDHIVTQEDLDNNPQLVEDGVKVGDTIQVPTNNEIAEDGALGSESINAAPLVTGEVNHNLHEAIVTAYGEDGKAEYTLGAIVRSGIMLTPEKAADLNFVAQRPPVGGTMHVYAAAE